MIGSDTSGFSGVTGIIRMPARIGGMRARALRPHSPGTMQPSNAVNLTLPRQKSIIGACCSRAKGERK